MLTRNAINRFENYIYHSNLVVLEDFLSIGEFSAFENTV